MCCKISGSQSHYCLQCNHPIIASACIHSKVAIMVEPKKEKTETQTEKNESKPEEKKKPEKEVELVWVKLEYICINLMF